MRTYTDLNVLNPLACFASGSLCNVSLSTFSRKVLLEHIFTAGKYLRMLRYRGVQSYGYFLEKSELLVSFQTSCRIINAVLKSWKIKRIIGILCYLRNHFPNLHPMPSIMLDF